MVRLPRLAIGTVQPEYDSPPILWALINVLERAGLHVQSFHSQSRFVRNDGARPVTGQSQRHLDSWLMTPGVCRRVFYRGARYSDVAVVDGRYDAALNGSSNGGSLDVLCDWLDLPRVVVLDVRTIDWLNPPRLPARVDGVLLDHVANLEEFCRLQTDIEVLWQTPVLGFMGPVGDLRAVINELPGGCPPSSSLCDALGDHLRQHLRLDPLVKLAWERSFPGSHSPVEPHPPSYDPLHVAIAYDEAFQCYFPDTLDLLEARGATLSVFSPLTSDSLPPETDLVYVGCGNVAPYAQALSQNCCLKNAIRTHVAQGRRVYAECAGMAYLCEHMRVGQRDYPMVGVLPATAVTNQGIESGRPVELSTSRPCWIAPTVGHYLRGYLNPHWRLLPADDSLEGIAEGDHHLDLVAVQNAIASRVHLNFALQPAALERFFQPCPAEVTS